jgi:hypothetical protein
MLYGGEISKNEEYRKEELEKGLRSSPGAYSAINQPDTQ